MWPLLFLLFASSGPAEAPQEGVGNKEVAAAGHWTAASWADTGVPRRRATRHLRLRVRRPLPRTVRTDEAHERRRADHAAARRIRQASAVARRVARATRSARTPSRIGFSDARPPAA